MRASVEHRPLEVANTFERQFPGRHILETVHLVEAAAAEKCSRETREPTLTVFHADGPHAVT